MLKADENQTPAPTGEQSSAPGSLLSPADPSANPPAATPAPAHHALRHEIRVWTRDLLIAIGLALVIIVFLYQPVKVEGTSMMRRCSPTRSASSSTNSFTDLSPSSAGTW